MASDPFFWVIVLVIAAVLIILMLGMSSFGKGGEFNRKNANRLMRWRIGVQFVAVILIVIFVYLRGQGG